MTKTNREGFAARSLRANLRSQSRGPTLLEWSMIRAGIAHGTEALHYLGIWTVARRKNGHEPSWAEFAEEAHVGRAAAYKALKRLQDVYGDDLAAFADSIEAKERELRKLLTLGSGRAKEAGGAAALIGPLAVPAGCKL